MLNLRKNRIIIALVVVVIVVVFIMISVSVQNKSLKPPQILISEEEWDFGKINPAEKPTHIFSIKNNGGEELIIGQVKASCGCTAAVLKSKNILSGETTELKVTFNPEGYEGKVKKAIYIDSNDPEVSKNKLTIMAEVEHVPSPKAEYSLDYWDLGLISQGDSPSFILPISNTGDDDLIVNKISLPEYMQHDIKIPLNIPPGEKSEVVLTYNSSEQKLGSVRESVRIFCNDPNKPAFSLRIEGYIKEKSIPTVSVSPISSNFSLTNNSESDAIEKFTIENSGENPIEIVSIKTSADYLAPLRSKLNLKSQEKQDFQVVLLKGKASEEIKENNTEEYIYLTIALPVKISK